MSRSYDDLSDFERTLFDSMMLYTENVKSDIDKAAKNIQMDLVQMVEEVSPVRKKYDGSGNVVGEHTVTDYKHNWVKGRVYATRDGHRQIYPVRNRYFQLTHLLNFDHRHFSHERYTGFTHQEHVGFVDEVSERAQRELGGEIERILEKEYYG